MCRMQAPATMSGRGLHACWGLHIMSAAHASDVSCDGALGQLFNQINARMINDELNVFRGILRPPMFLWILLLEAALQARALSPQSQPVSVPCTSMSRQVPLQTLVIAMSSSSFSLLGIMLRMSHLYWAC